MAAVSALAKRWSMLVILIVITILASTATRAAPRTQEPAPQADAATVVPLIPYQGRLLIPSTGEPQPDGSYAMTFRIYDVATGGTELWSETKELTVSRGLFNTYLGDVNSIDQSIFTGADLWLGVKVRDDAETMPRMRLGFSPYALWSIDADTVDSQDASSFAAASHSHTGNDISDGSIGAADIADGSIGAADIADGSIGSADIADGAIGAADIANSAVGTADLADGAVTSAKLAAGITSPKFLDLNVYSAYLEGTASFYDGFATPGINFPDGSSTGSLAFSFVVPPDYASGTTFLLNIIWHTSATHCQLTLLPNFVHASRNGMGLIHGGGSVSRGLDGVGGNLLAAPAISNLTQLKLYTIVSPDPAIELEPGDVILFGLFRSPTNASDTCASTLVIKGATITYDPF